MSKDADRVDDVEEFSQWLGNSEERQDRITAWPSFALSAALDRDDPLLGDGAPIPPMRHWLYFLEAARAGELGPDGHPARGGFLPPIPLPRRMWAAGRMELNGPLRVGDKVRRRSTVQDIRSRQGRTGPLIFVKVVHDFFVADAEEPMLREVHTLAYRDNPVAGQPDPIPRPAPADPAWTQSMSVDSVLLFRYSALTFNGHRIHYDADYCRDQEGYPGLVVHGPLLATLALDLCLRETERTPKMYDFRVLRPIFADNPITVAGCLEKEGGAKVWILDQTGALALEGRVEFAPQDKPGDDTVSYTD